jgi:type II secretory ATPase GspE/PulE/Tfp pilus assembly ATPase PilB-like protein
MAEILLDRLPQDVAGLDPADPQYASRAVELVLAAGRDCGVSDVHLLPSTEGLEVRMRIDGVLQPVVRFPKSLAANVVARLKVLSELLTYRTDVAQEGRIRGGGDVEMRVSTFPTLHGEKAVVRFFGVAGQYRYLADLGLPGDVRLAFERLLSETGGAILVTGPAGSGKTTTAYACLRELAARPTSRSLVSLEDPIEVPLDGVAQSQVNPQAGLDLAVGLRFLMRQDPEVILVGEIRDRATAEAALQASLTGHLLLSTFHAGSAAEAVGRLADMGIEPYVLRSGLLAVINQRLARRLCGCARACDDPAAALGLPVRRFLRPTGCAACRGSGYQGRLLLVEMLTVGQTELGRAILGRSDAGELQRLAVAAGMITRWQRACQAIESGATSPAEVRRVLGLSEMTLGDRVLLDKRSGIGYANDCSQGEPQEPGGQTR